MGKVTNQLMKCILMRAVNLTDQEALCLKKDNMTAPAEEAPEAPVSEKKKKKKV